MGGRVALGQAASDRMKRLTVWEKWQRLRSGPSMVDIREAYTLLPGIESEDPLHVPGHRHQAPFAPDPVEPAQQELAKAENRFDDTEHGFRSVLASSVELLAFGRGQAVRHGFERGWILRCGRCRGKALVQGRVMRGPADRKSVV